MENYPQFILNDPRPLAYLTGSVDDEPDIHSRLIQSLDKSNTEIDQRDFPPLHFKTISVDHPFVVRKAPKEFQSVDGILKYSSLQKHYESLPSVVVFLTSFSIDWQQSDWNQQGDLLLSKLNHLRTHLSPRDVKIVVVAVKSGSGYTDKDLLEERLNWLKRHLVLDNRTFATITLADLSLQAQTLPLRRLSKNLRELSYMYYNLLEKRARFLMKNASIRGANEGILTARYCFKLAFFLSFQGLKLQSIKYYRQCFESLQSIALTIDDDLVDQMKAVAEFAHLKICTMYLFSGSVKEAMAQFMAHITSFSRVRAEIVWRHYAWLTDQYNVFLQLLDMHKISSAELATEGLDRIFFLYNAARYTIKRQDSFVASVSGTYATNTLPGGSTVDDQQRRRMVQQRVQGLVPKPSTYVGALPTLIDPVLGGGNVGVGSMSGTVMRDAQETGLGLGLPLGSGTGMELTNSNKDLGVDEAQQAQLTLAFLEDSERMVDHSAMVLQLLKRCDDLLLSMDTTTPTTNTTTSTIASTASTTSTTTFSSSGSSLSTSRRRIQWCTLVAEQYLKSRQYDLASNALTTAVRLLDEENWTIALNKLLRLQLDCAYHQGKLQEYVQLAWRLCELRIDPTVISLQDDIIHLVKPGTIVTSVGEPVGVTSRATYGSAVASNQMKETTLPSNCRFQLRGHVENNGGSIGGFVSSGGGAGFIVGGSSSSSGPGRAGGNGTVISASARYSQSAVELGKSVTVTLTMISQLYMPLTIDEMVVVFTGGKLTKTLKHNANATSMSSSTVVDVNKDPFVSLSSSVTAASAATASSSSVTEACLQLPGNNQPVTFSFTLFIPESVLATLPATDLAICMERVDLVLYQAPGQIPSQIILEVTTLSSTFAKILKEREQVSVTGKPAPTIAMKDMVAFVGPRKSPEILILTRPVALLTLLTALPSAETSSSSMSSVLSSALSSSASSSSSSLNITTPPTISTTSTQPSSTSNLPSSTPSTSTTPPIHTAKLLQGPIQRLDFIFQVGDNYLTDGRVYLSSDYSPTSSSAALFWYPDVGALEALGPVSSSSSSSSSSSHYTSQQLDGIPFHPVALNSSCQPSLALALPPMSPHTIYCVPLFLRSEMQNTFKVRILTEFIPQTEDHHHGNDQNPLATTPMKSPMTTRVSKEIEVHVSFLRPLQMNFSLQAKMSQEAPCGVPKEGNLSTILRGDVVNVAASLGCVNALGGAIQVLGLSFIKATVSTPPSSATYQGTTAGKDLFLLVDEEGPVVEGTTGIDGGGAVSSSSSSSSTFDLLHRSIDYSDPSSSSLGQDKSLNKGVCLKKGEVFVTSVDVKCRGCTEDDMVQSSVNVPTDDDNTYGAVVASLGELYVDWRMDDPTILTPPNLSRKGDATREPGGSTTTTTIAIRNQEVVDLLDLDEGINDHKGSHRQEVDVMSLGESGSGSLNKLDWLLKWTNAATTNPTPSTATTSSSTVLGSGMEAVAGTTLTTAGATSTITFEEEEGPLDRLVGTTRVCGMVFSVPRVQVAEPPFDVHTSIASGCGRDELLQVVIRITNRKWTTEHVQLAVACPDNTTEVMGGSKDSGFLLVGSSKALLDLAPKGICTIQLSLLPLYTGFVPLPHIRVTWERNGAAVMEIGSISLPRHVFVRP